MTTIPLWRLLFDEFKAPPVFDRRRLTPFFRERGRGVNSATYPAVDLQHEIFLVRSEHLGPKYPPLATRSLLESVQALAAITASKYAER